MRFCPFCASENEDEATHCMACARRLPPVARRGSSTGDLRDASIRPQPRSLSRQAGDTGSGSGSGVGSRSISPPPPRRATSTNNRGAASLSPVPSASPLPGALRAGTAEPVVAMIAADPPGAIVHERPASRRIDREESERLARELELPLIASMPEVPEPGVWSATTYTLAYVRALWQRRRVVRALVAQIEERTAALDKILGELGGRARDMRLEGKALDEENRALDAADKKRTGAGHAQDQLSARRDEEIGRYEDTRRQLEARLAEQEASTAAAAQALEEADARRRQAREARKELERQQKNLRKMAEEKDAQAAKDENASSAQQMRAAAASFRKQAGELEARLAEAAKQVTDREKEHREAEVAHASARGELDAARRAVDDAREGHRHRLAELDAEQGRRSTESSQAEREIVRRLATLGTLVNLHRVDRPELTGYYERIDELKGAIAARDEAKDRLAVERAGYDRGAVVRGATVLAAAFVLLVTAVCVIWVVLA